MFPSLDDYDTNDIRQIHLYSWQFDLFALKRLIEFNNDGLNSIVRNLSNKATNACNTGDFKRHSNLITEIQAYNKIEPWMFQSTFLSLYSVVEASLDRYCDLCKDIFDLRISKEDLKDKGIVRAVKYLEKVVEVENIRSDNRWAKMLNLNKLRNDIIHNSGIVYKTKNINLYKNEFDIELTDGRVYLIYENMSTIFECIEKFMIFVFSRDLKDKNRSFKIQINK